MDGHQRQSNLPDGLAAPDAPGPSRRGFLRMGMSAALVGCAQKATTTSLPGPVWKARDLPPELGNWHATFTRFARWRRKGVWQRVIEAISGDVDLESLLNTIVRPTGTKNADPWLPVDGTTLARRNHKDSNYDGYAG